MSDPSPQIPPAEGHANDADVQHERKSLEQQLESIDLNDPQSNTASEETRIIKRSARDLLERLHSRRLEVTLINFTGGGTQAGKGSHGEVVIATFTCDNGTSSESTNQVAVKKFLISENTDQEKFLRSFANELRILDGLDHPNIIKLIGFVEDLEKRIAWLVFPWEANGNIREFLLSGQWELPERVSLIKDVASGLEYLHTRRPPVRHGDLKSLNILVNSEHRAIITDFGSARVQTEARGFGAAALLPRRPAASTNSDHASYDGRPEVTVSATNAELTLTGPSWSFRWAAPEILNEEEPCLASDMWAFGWIAWEVVTDNYPFPEAKTNQLITVKVVKGLLPLIYDDSQLSQVGRLCDIMVRCWKPEPEDRLSAAECNRDLQWVPSTVPRTRSDGKSQIRSAALLMEIGEMQRMQSRYKESLTFFEEAFAAARSSGDKGMMARALWLSGDTHPMLSNYDRAEEACNQSLEIYTSIGDSAGRASTLRSLGVIHQARTNYTKAEECFNQALAIFTSIGSRVGQANTLRRLGETHNALSSHAKAEEQFKQSLTIFMSIGDSLGQGNALLGLGETHKAQSNYSAAEESFNHALATYTRIGYNYGRALSLLGLGEVLLRQARYSEAKSFIDDLAEVSNQMDYEWAQTRSKELRAEILEAEKSPTEASP